MRNTLWVVLMTISAGPNLASSPAIIDTVAGGGSPNGVPAVAANLQPSAIRLGPGGDLYLADAYHNRVYRIDSAGLLTAVVGTGVRGSEGDGGPATEATITQPEGLAFDRAGNLFVAGGLRVRRIDAATGIITTLAGSDTWASTGDGGPAAAATFRRPTDLVFDADGNLYILDEEALRVRRINANTGLISTYAGGGNLPADGWPATATYFLYPTALAFDLDGNLLVAESHRVRRVNRSTTIVSTVAGSSQSGFGGDGGPAASSLLNHPEGLAFNGAGDLLISDGLNHRVRRVDRLTGVISTIAGSGTRSFSGDGGPALQAALAFPRNLAVSSTGDLFIMDGHNLRVRLVDHATHDISTIAGNGDCCFFGEGVPARSAEFFSPRDVALDGRGNIFVHDSDNFRIRRIDHRTGIIATFAGNGIRGYSGDGGSATSASFGYGGSIAADAAGNLFVGDSANHRVRRIDAGTGIVQTIAGDGTTAFDGEGVPAISSGMSPGAVYVGAGGDLFLIDGANMRVRRIDMQTGLIYTVAGNGVSAFSQDGQLASDSSLYFPWDISLDRAGNLLIAEGGYNDEMDPIGSNRIRRVDALTGVLTTVAGTGAFFSGPSGVPAISSGVFLPSSVAVDGAGNFYFSESFDFENGSFRGGVRGVTASTGIVDRVTGPKDYLASCLFGGDGGPAIDSSVCFPAGLATDASGNLFISDWGNRRIRRVRLGNSPPVASAGGDVTTGCTTPAGAQVTLDGSASTDLDSMPGTDDDIASWDWLEQPGQGSEVLLGSGRTIDVMLPAGPHTIMLRVTDRAGAGSTATKHVTVAQGPPAGLSISLSPTLLWPPNHRMVPVTVAVTSDSACEAPPDYTLLSVTSSEPDDVPGGSDGNTSGDIQDVSANTSDFSFLLRAERDAQGTGRRYDVTYLASNASGQATITAGLTVPHDVGGQVDPIVLSAVPTPTGTRLQWNEVPGARHYNVIRGDLAGLKVIGGGVDLRIVQCLASRCLTADTTGHEDSTIPLPGQITFYLVEYDDGTPSGYGSPEADRPLLEPRDICP